MVPGARTRVSEADAVRAGHRQRPAALVGPDQLWQSEDSRYSADSVRIIPRPISVAGITTVDEPVADILGRFEAAMVKRVSAESASADKTAFAQLGAAVSAEEFIRKSPNISSGRPPHGQPRVRHRQRRRQLRDPQGGR